MCFAWSVILFYGPLRIRLLNDQWLTAVLWSGFARIVNNEIIIFGNDAELGSDIDPEEAQTKNVSISFFEIRALLR
ncbi:hypothetical protein ZWY2020_032771 [Hordeum vulgare]|nr:hypothetical protein ZWY2020_032771 [Hordeum vulgare]